MPKPVKKPKQIEAEGSGRAMTWFVIIIMVASTAGFAFVASQSSYEPSAPPAPPDLGQPTVVDYAADSVEAEVVEVFSSMFISASTSEAEIARIDSELYTIEGVRTINSRYRTAGQAITSGLVYIAEITLAPDVGTKEMLERIEEQSNYLSGLEGGSFGLVTIPTTVTLSNPDLNLTKHHTFDDPLIQAYLLPETQKGDSLLIAMSLQVSGEQVFNMVAYETQNTTIGHEFLSLQDEFVVDSLVPFITFSDDLNYSQAPDQDEVKNAVWALDGILSAEMEFGDVAPIVTVEFDANISDLEEDINSALSSIEGIEDVRFFSARPGLNFNFDEEMSPAEFKSLRQEAISGLESLGLRQFNFIDPRITVHADINTTSPDTYPLVEQLRDTLRGYGITPVIYQRATFSAETFTDPDTDRTYVVPEGTFEGMVAAGKRAGNPVELSVFFSSFRDEARDIMAVEKLPAHTE